MNYFDDITDLHALVEGVRLVGLPLSIRYRAHKLALDTATSDESLVGVVSVKLTDLISLMYLRICFRYKK